MSTVYEVRENPRHSLVLHYIVFLVLGSRNMDLEGKNDNWCFKVFCFYYPSVGHLKDFLINKLWLRHSSENQINKNFENFHQSLTLCCAGATLKEKEPR